MYPDIAQFNLDTVLDEWIEHTQDGYGPQPFHEIGLTPVVNLLFTNASGNQVQVAPEDVMVELDFATSPKA